MQRRAPLLTVDIHTIVQTARDQAVAGSWAQKVHERRDTALILLGFAGAFRRSELAALTTGDIRCHLHDGLHVRVGKSKTDQEGQGLIKAIPYGRTHHTCPVCAYLRWRQVLDAWDVGVGSAC